MGPESMLPVHLLERATLRGRELAWTVADIPEVIEAARSAGLVSIGGQLQFRFPDGVTCECYWIEVDTFRTISPDLPWQERVRLTAEEASLQFRVLRECYDFAAEGRNACSEYIDRFEASRGKLLDAMCFVWYLEECDGASRSA